MNNRKRLVSFVAGGLLSLLLVTSASAQFRASLQGSVVDPNGGVVPEASLTLTSQETSFARTGTSNGEGVFTLSGLAPGKYTLTVEKPGFSKKVLSDLQIGAEQAQSITVALVVGQTSESVTVAGDSAPVLDTETATIGGTITTREIQTLPSFSRDPYQLLRLAPGVFGDGSLGAGGGGTQLPGTNKSGPSSTDSIFQVENGPGIIANGTRQNSNNFQIDGLSVNSTVWGGSAVVTPNEESVKEVRVIANNYSAENGRTSGAQIEVVSQNGTNDVHGSGFLSGIAPASTPSRLTTAPEVPAPSKEMRAASTSSAGPSAVLFGRINSSRSFLTKRCGTTRSRLEPLGLKLPSSSKAPDPRAASPGSLSLIPEPARRSEVSSLGAAPMSV